MPKIEIAKVNTPLNSHEFQSQINKNFEKVSEALDKQLQREPQEGVENYMGQEINMGGHRIINLAKAVDPSDAMRKKEFDEKIANIEQWAQEAKGSAASAAEDADAAEEARRVAVSAAQSAYEHNEQIQQLHDELLADESVPVVAENIEDVKAVAGSIDNVNTAVENLEDIKSVFDIAKRIAYGNIGDIRATFAATAPEGCRFTDGTEIKKEDYPELFEMLEKGGMPYDSIAVWTSNVNSKGITGAFGYDPGSTTARLPLLTEAFVEATNKTPHRVNEAAMPEHGHKVKTNVNAETYVTSNLTYNPTEAKAFNASPSHYAASATRITSAFSTTANYEGGSAVGGVTGIAVSDKVQPKSIMLRHYVVLTNSRQMILTSCTSVAKKSDLPTTGNNNGDVRIVTSEGVAYVWARSSATTWMWSSIGRVGTSGSGVVEWVDIQGDIAQNADLTKTLDKKISNNTTIPYSYAMGVNARVSFPGEIALGRDADARGHSSRTSVNQMTSNIAIGLGARVPTATGDALASQNNIAIGDNANISNDGTGIRIACSTAVGSFSGARADDATAIGSQAVVKAPHAMQLGKGTNTTEGSLQFRGYTLVDANGKIPTERLSDDIYKALSETQKTQLLSDGTYNGAEIADGAIFTEHNGKFVEFDKTLNPGGNMDTSGATTKEVGFDENFGHFVSTQKNPDNTRYSRFVKSVDGLNWEPLSDYTYETYNNPNPYNIFFCNDKLYMSYGYIKYSVDGGATWTNTTGLSTNFANIAYGNGIYVAASTNVSQGIMYVSADGIAFEQVSFPVARTTGGPVVFNNGVFLTVASQSSYTAYLSTDGRTWEAVSTPVSFEIRRNSIISLNGYFYAVSRANPYSLYRSIDGRSWEKVIEAPTFFTDIATDGTNIVGYYYMTASSSYKSFVLSENGEISTEVDCNGKGTFCYGNGWFVAQSARFSLQPYYEYSLTDLSYNKAEVDAAVAGAAPDLTEYAKKTDLTGYLQNKLSDSGSLGVGTYSKVYTGADTSSLFFGKNITVSSDNSLSIGNSSRGGRYGIAIGTSADSSGANWGVCIGNNSSASLCSTAVGYQAKATATRAIQLGAGTNNEAGTFKVALNTDHGTTPTNYTLLDVNGKIPVERLPDGIGGGSSNLTETAYAGEGIRLVTEPVENYEIQGTSVVVSDDYIASSFTGSSYIKHNVGSLEAPKGLAFEATFSVSSVSATQILQLRNSGNSVVGRLALNANGNILGGIGSATLTSASTFTAGQKVSARLVYDTQTMSLYSKVDEGEWTLERSNALSPEASTIADVVATGVVLGLNATTATIYLPECALSYQGKEIWRAVEGVGKTGIAVDILDANGKIPSARLPENSFFAPATGTWTALTLGASNTEYEAPANGYFVLYAQQSDGNEKFISMRNKSTYGEVLGADHYWNTTFGATRLFVPAKKGHKIVVEYNCGLKSLWFGFIPADGTS